ncbi:DUF6265 family protein [Maribacter sp. CXY002]|uniref:DUF6265 family protein n=1 Tax=Maribacter luteocoastalis TaxID=3407671 RepID=UPI003B681902
MRYILLVFICISFKLTAQNTISYVEGTASPKAKLAAIDWLTGHWKGEAFGGIAEEIWSPPLGGSMMFSFKLVINNKVNFYELGHIKEIDGTLLLQLKHFSSDLKGWEEKENTIDFKLVKIAGDIFYFDDFTIERISDKKIHMYVLIEHEDGAKEEAKFEYTRQ